MRSRSWGTRLAAALVAGAAAVSAGLVAGPAVAAPSGEWRYDAPGWGWERVTGEGVWYTSPHGVQLVPDAGGMALAHGGVGGGRGALGYPRGSAAPQTAPFGNERYQVFERGVLYSSGAGTFHTLNSSSIAVRYAATGGGGGPLGYPSSNEIRQGAGRWYQTFLAGGIYAGPAGTFDVGYGVHLEVDSHWGARSLGYPTGPNRADAGTYRHQTFERAVVYCIRTPLFGDECATVRGGFLAVHASNGGGRGWLGYPLRNEVYEPATGSWWQEFERGVVEITPGGVRYHRYGT